MAFDFVPSEQFFEILYNDVEFCNGLGKVMLSASKLETNLRKYLTAKSITFKPTSALGVLVGKLMKNNLLSKNGQMHFKDLVAYRNYMAHNLYGLFIKEIGETIIKGRDELTALDTDNFIYQVRQLADDFLYFAKIVAEADINATKLL